MPFDRLLDDLDDLRIADTDNPRTSRLDFFGRKFPLHAAVFHSDMFRGQHGEFTARTRASANANADGGRQGATGMFVTGLLLLRRNVGYSAHGTRRAIAANWIFRDE